MNTREFFGYLAIIALLMALVALVEVVVPLRARTKVARKRNAANLSLTLVVFALNWLLSMTTPLLALALSLGGVGLLTGSGLWMPLQIAISVVLLDLFTYLAHLVMHKVPLLWRVHQVHHSDPFVDVSTTYRNHPLEGLWRYLWTIVPALVLGLPAQGIVIYRLISAVNALFEHGNFSLGRSLDRALSWIWVTPNMHKIHHSNRVSESDSNYGNILAVYDRLFRTFTPTVRAIGVVYGLTDVRPERAGSLGELLRMPFTRTQPEPPALPHEVADCGDQVVPSQL